MTNTISDKFKAFATGFGKGDDLSESDAGIRGYLDGS